MAPTTRSGKTTTRVPNTKKNAKGSQASRKSAATSQKVLKKPAQKNADHKRPPLKTPPSTGKRKRGVGDVYVQSTPKMRDATSKKANPEDEKRLKTFRNHAPQTFLEKLRRAQTQRMIVVGRTRLNSATDPREEIDIVGTTGNIYKVTIGRLPQCTCPDHLKGNECKHKVYALHTVLKAPEHLQYQRALLTTELDEIFSNAPPIPTHVGSDEEHDGKRKPIQGECPICYMDLEEDESKLVWCKAACGNNMHKSCFEQWAASQRGKTVRCVYCRADWEMDKSDLKSLQKAGTLDGDGYFNVASHFGMSGARDYSTYHQPWVRSHVGYGW